MLFLGEAALEAVVATVNPCNCMRSALRFSRSSLGSWSSALGTQNKKEVKADDDKAEI